MNPKNNNQRGLPRAAPVAPPVYRPQPVPRVLQNKMVAGQQANHSKNVLQQRKLPVPPPAYRPQPPPKVLQTRAPIASPFQPAKPATSHSVQRQRQNNRSVQPRVSQPAAPKIIQRYTVIKEHGYRWKVSENGVYATGKNLSEIYVQAGHTVERSTRTAERVDIQNQEYEVWVPEFNVIGDCVACMEEILHGQKLKYGVPDLSEFCDIDPQKPRLFGESDPKNRKRGRDSDEGYKAAPDVLEAYVIARQKYKRDQARPQFH